MIKSRRRCPSSFSSFSGERPLVAESSHSIPVNTPNLSDRYWEKRTLRPISRIARSRSIFHASGMDNDYEYLIDQAFLEEQIDGASRELAMLHSMNDLPSNILRVTICGSDRHMLLMRKDEQLRGNDDIALNRLFSYRNWQLSLYPSCKTRGSSISTDSLGLLVARSLNWPI
jgi:hypothetical protein